MDTKKFFEELSTQKLLKLEERNRLLDKKVSNYLKRMINHISKNKKDAIDLDTMLIPMGDCDTHCNEILDQLVDIKINSELKKYGKYHVHRKVTETRVCRNPGFLGLYNLFDHSNCEKYYSFDYIMDMNYNYNKDE